MRGMYRTLERKTGNLLVKALSPYMARKHTNHNVEYILEREKGLPTTPQSQFSATS